MTSLQRNTGALRTPWPRLRWLSSLEGWLTDENGIFDHDAAVNTWADCLEAGGELDKQAEAEATEKALDSLLSHGVVEDMKREDAAKF